MNKQDTKRAVLEFYDKGKSLAWISGEYHISRQTIYAWAKQTGRKPRRATDNRSCAHCGGSFIAQSKTTRKHCPGCYHKFLKQTAMTDAYQLPAIGLSVRQKQRNARAVAMQHVKPWRKEFVVHHLDGDLDNCDPNNLFIFRSQSDHLKYHHEHRKNGNIRPNITAGSRCL